MAIIMRNAFAKTITRLARTDPRLVLISGDIGNRMFDDFKKIAPDRFYNVGIAEQSMIGVAAGLALAGMRPMVYTIAPFVVTRCLEQIKVDLCYHRLPVTLVGTGAGLSYASLGATHHSPDDIAQLRPLPNMTVVCPADAIETRLATEAAVSTEGPCYLRIGKKGEPDVHPGDPAFAIGRAIVIRQAPESLGRRVAILATGSVVPMGVSLADRLESHGVTATVWSYHTVKPLDLATLDEAFDGYDVVVTLEEHYAAGGFGSAVAEWLTDGPTRRASLVRCGLIDGFSHHAGEQDDARRRLGLSADALLDRVTRRLNHRGRAVGSAGSLRCSDRSPTAAA